MLGQGRAGENSRQYEKNEGFVSTVTTVPAGPLAITIWAVGIAAINPAGGRTAGLETTVYTFEIENSTGAAVTAWLETAGGVALTPPIHVANNDTVIIDFIAGKNFGDQDLYLNASVAGVIAQICGTEA